MNRTLNDLELLLSRQLNKVYGIPGDADRKLRIFFRVLHRVKEKFPANDIDVPMVPFVSEVSVE